MIDKTSYALLKRLYSKGDMTPEELDAFTGNEDQYPYNKQASMLRENHFIEDCSVGGKRDGEGGHIGEKHYIRISMKGRAYIEQRQRDSRNFWVPYIITTIIAIASLIVAVASLAQ